MMVEKFDNPDRSLSHELWCNADNECFYENITESEFIGFSNAVGLNDNMDLHLLAPYLANARHVLEVGAGYGRVLEFFSQQERPPLVTAIERSQRFFRLLKQKYHPSMNIICGDILQCAFTEKFDIILWLWSGLTDFTYSEQRRVLEKVKNFLSDRGVLIIDTIHYETLFHNPAFHTVFHQRCHVMRYNKNVIYGFTPSKADIEIFCHALGLSLEESIYYETTSYTNRVMYVISQSV